MACAGLYHLGYSMMNCSKDGTFFFFNHKNLKLRQKIFCYLLVLLKNSKCSLIEIVVWILYLPFPHRQKCRCLLLFQHSKAHLLPRVLHTLSLTTTTTKKKTSLTAKHRKIPCRMKWQPAPVLLPGKSHGQRSLEGYSLWSHKESDMTE